MTGFDRMKAQLVAALTAHLKQPDLPPMVPEAGVVLWQAFIELDAARIVHASGPAPIGFADIDAWSRLKRYQLEPRHVDVLRAMDAEMMRILHARARDAAKRKAFTPKLFDASF